MIKDSLYELAKSIQNFSSEHIDDAEAQDAALNLSGFMSVLIEIDQEQASLNKKGKGNENN